MDGKALNAELQRLIQEYRGLALAVIRRTPGTAESAEDIWQDVLLLCVKQIMAGTAPDSWRAWIQSVAHNQAVNLVRKELPHRKWVDMVERGGRLTAPSNEQNPSSLPVANLDELWSRLPRVMKRLAIKTPPISVFELLVILSTGQTQEVIAQGLGIARSTLSKAIGEINSIVRRALAS